MSKKSRIFQSCFLSFVLAFTSVVTPVMGDTVHVAQAAAKMGISAKKATVKVGDTKTLKISGTGKKVTWSSSKKSVARVNSKGKVTAWSPGKATITGKVSGKKFTCIVTVPSVKISDTEVDLVAGDTQTLSVTGVTKTVTWTSGNQKVAKVASKGKYSGKVTAVGAGEATISAKLSGTTVKCKVSVKAENIDVTDIKLDKDKADLKIGDILTLKATVSPEDATDKTVEWNTSNESVAKVSATGRVTAISEGTARIIAVAGEKSAICTIIVRDEEVAAATVLPNFTVTPTVTDTPKPEITVEPTIDVKVVETVSPTPAPTLEPTPLSETPKVAEPTIVPTLSPTVAPTPLPVIPEVSEPAVTPTALPTQEPIRIPEPEESDETPEPALSPDTPEISESTPVPTPTQGTTLPTQTPKESEATTTPTITPAPSPSVTEILYSGSWENTKWTIDSNGLLEVSGTGNMYRTDFYDYSGTLKPEWLDYKDDIISARIEVTGATSLKKLFYQCTNLTSVDLSKLDTSNVTNMNAMFFGCEKLTSADLSSWNTSNVTDMAGMFCSCRSLTEVNLSGFDTSNVTAMYMMFDSCKSLTSLDLSSFDISGARSYTTSTSIDNMLRDCSSLKEIQTPKKSGICVPYLPTGTWRDSNGDAYTRLPSNRTKSVTLTKRN